MSETHGLVGATDLGGEGQALGLINPGAPGPICTIVNIRESSFK